MKPTTLTFSFLFALVTSFSTNVAFAQVIWSDDVSDCSSWTFGNGSGESNQPWAGIDLNFECSTEGPAGPYNGWAGGNNDGTPAPGINSTTGGNGFLLLDSDEYGAEEGYSAFWVENSWAQTTEPINLEGHPQVRIAFETRYRCYDNGSSDGSEKCFVEFSRDGVTWPTLTSSYVTDWAPQGLVNYDGEVVQCRYEVFPESQSGFITEDPSLVELNVSEAVGDQAEVWVRFRWVGTWGYSWEIDDIAITEIPPNDLRIGDDVSPTNYAETGYFENGTWALSQIPQDLTAFAQAYNAGTQSQNNVQLSLEVNGTILTSTFGAVSPNDSIAAYFSYNIEDVGEYTLNYTVSSDSVDAEPMNNSTSQSVTVTEHIYGRDNGTIESAWPSANDPFVDYVAMPLYNIHNDVMIYGIDVALMDVGDLGYDVYDEVRALLYDIDGTGNPPDGQYDGAVLESEVVELTPTFTNNLGDEDVTWVTLLFEEPYAATAGQLLGAAFESFGAYPSQVAEAQEVPSQTAWYYGPFGASSTYGWYWSNNVPMVRLNLDPDAVTSGVLVSGCTDSEANNFNPEANGDDGSCQYDVFGCMDPGACNYDSGATIDDGSCDFSCIGCTDSNACNYDPEATISSWSCVYPGYYVDCDGNCLNDEDGDGVCDELEITGCTIEAACNFNSSATESDITVCLYPGDLCNDQDPNTADDTYNFDCECIGQGPQGGCINPNACNYDANADYSDGSCVLVGYPCDDGDFTTTGDIYGEDCTCAGEPSEIGCSNPNACNYNPIAVESDGSCLFPGDPCDDGDPAIEGFTYTDECVCEGNTTAVAEAEGAMRLYPNPAYGHVVVELGAAEVSSVLVFDQWGRQVKSTQVAGIARLDLGSLAAGTYQVVAQQGDAVLMRRPLVVLEGR